LVVEMVFPSTARFITGADPQDCPRARTTTVADAGRVRVFDAVAGERRTSATPCEAFLSLTVEPAAAGDTLIDSASMEVESAAVATGLVDMVMTHAATITALAMKARTPRKARISDSTSKRDTGKPQHPLTSHK